MDDAVSVGEGDRLADALEGAQAFGQGDGAGVLVQPQAPDALHGVKGAAVGEQAGVVDGDDAGVLQAGEHTGLAQQAVDVLRGAAGQLDHLEGDLAVEPAVEGEINGAHAAAADRLQDLVGGAGEIREIGDLPQMLEGVIRDHFGSTPSTERASARNSSSEPVSSRSRSSTSRRNSRRTAARWLVTWVAGMPCSAASWA
jgi:hypothetical protein